MYQTYATSDNYTANLSTRHIAFFILLDLIIVILILLGRFHYLLGGVALIFFAYLIINNISWGLYFIPISIATPLVIVPGTKLHLGEFTVFFLLCSYLCYSALRGEIRGISFPKKYTWFLILFFASAFLSLINAPHPKMGLILTIKLVLAFIFIFALIYNFLADRKTLKKMILMVIGAGLIAAFYGILQYFLAVGTISPGYGPRIFGRAGGGYGAFIGIAIVMSISIILRSKSLVKVIIYISFLPPLVLALLLSRTRAWILGTIIAVGLVLFINLFKNTHRKKLICLVVVLILCTLMFVGLVKTLVIDTFSFLFLRHGNIEANQQIKNFGLKSDLSLALRYQLWGFAFSTFLQHPLTGIGEGNFRIKNALRPELSEKESEGGWSDNHYVNILAETGILGALAWIYLGFLLYSTSVRIVKSNKDADLKYAPGLIGSLIILAVGGIFWNLTSALIDSALFALIIALIFSMGKVINQEESN